MNHSSTVVTETELDTPDCPAVSANSDFASQRKRILIIQSSSSTPLPATSRLFARGYDITVRDTSTASAGALQNSPDLLLLDISASADEGFALANHIQELIRWRVPILFLTVTVLPHLHAKAEDFNAIGFFETTSDPDHLLAAVDLALAE